MGNSVHSLTITATLGRLAAGENLSQTEMTAAMDAVMDGQVADEQIALLLTALRAKGETVEEIAGAATSLRKHMTRIESRHEIIVDTCGTGGIGSKLFNISTTAALVTAAAGVPVAKHGNRAVTSRTGSADVLAALGVNISADLACVERCLEELGICFCFAPLDASVDEARRRVRNQLGIRTIFNLLGPLCNPAEAPFQLLGVGRPELRQHAGPSIGDCLAPRHSVVVHGDGGLGEVTIAGATAVTEVAGEHDRRASLDRRRFRLDCRRRIRIVLEIENAEQSAALIRRVLAGEPAPRATLSSPTPPRRCGWPIQASLRCWPRQGRCAKQAESTAARPTICSAQLVDYTRSLLEHEPVNHAWLRMRLPKSSSRSGLRHDDRSRPKQPAKFDYQGQTYYFCNPGCLKKFQAQPDVYLSKTPGRQRHAVAGVATAQSSRVDRSGLDRQPRLLSTLCDIGPPTADHRPLRLTPARCIRRFGNRGPERCPKCGMALSRKQLPRRQTRTEWTCPMHPEIVRDEPGSCPICGMALEPKTVTADEAAESRTGRYVAAVLDQPGSERAAVCDGDDRHVAGDADCEHWFGARPLRWIAIRAGHAGRAVGRLAVFRARLAIDRASLAEHVHADCDRHRGGVRVQRRRHDCAAVVSANRCTATAGRSTSISNRPP